MAVKIFYCYAREDEPLLNELKIHLEVLRRLGLIEMWHAREINAGEELAKEIDEHLNTAEIILILVSQYFIASDYCYGIEMKRAMERHERGEARVIPIILRPVYFEGAPFGKLKVLPTNAKAVKSKSWHNLDEAFFNIAEGIRKVVKEVSSKTSPPLAAISIKQAKLESRQVAVNELKQQQGRWDAPISIQRPASSRSMQTLALQLETSNLEQQLGFSIQPAKPEPRQAPTNVRRFQSPRPLRVFLCHSSGDKPIVRELYQRLKDRGIAPWLDEEDLLPGQNWQLEIPKAVRDCDIVIICLSINSINKAGYIQKEIKFALDVANEQPEGTIFLIPLKLEECTIPNQLLHLQWVNYSEERGFDKLMEALKARAQSLI